MAINARFRFPLPASRQNRSRRKQFFLTLAAHAHSTSDVRSQRFPCVTCGFRSLPALRVLPGQTPAHELK
jgi:hypothetical protein